MAFTKKHKVNQENSHFKPDWTDHLCFILPDCINAKPTCLLCMQTGAVSKAENLKRHFNTMPAASFNINYPPKSDHCKNKKANIPTSYKQSVSTISKSKLAQESATAASSHVAWTLAKDKKPFADADLNKKCANDMAGEF